MAVSRVPRSPQKAMAILLGLALVFSLLLFAVSRESDLHVVHDRTGGHFEHDHHRVFDVFRDASSIHGGANDGDRARAHPSRLLHGAVVGGSQSSHLREARAGGFGGGGGAGGFGGAGGAVGGSDASVRSRAGFEAARGGERVGDDDDLFRPNPGASRARFR